MNSDNFKKIIFKFSPCERKFLEKVARIFFLKENTVFSTLRVYTRPIDLPIHFVDLSSGRKKMGVMKNKNKIFFYQNDQLLI
jgi:hypothetical protein